MNTKTILILDRDEQVCVTIRAMLEIEGHTVFVAAAPADLLTELSKRPVDVVLTNRVFGRFEQEATLLAMIRAMQPQTAIVLTTGWHGELDTPAPFDALLRKPFSIQDVREVIAGVTRRRR